MTETEKHRRSVRLDGYDYRNGGLYFVTICTKNREHMFGEIRNGIMGLTDWGCVASQCWRFIPDHFNYVSLYEFVVMPNHVHGILHLDDPDYRHMALSDDAAGRGTIYRAPTTLDYVPQRHFGTSIAGSLSTIIGTFKAAVTRQIGKIDGEPGAIIWQRNYHEHIIRSEEERWRIEKYIIDNPIQWNNDPDNI